MSADSAVSAPVDAKVALVDPASMTVVWMNEAAASDLPGGATGIGRPLAEAVPLTASLGLAEAAAQVAATGKPEHRRVALVSTAKGSLIIVASVYRLPGGELLVVQDRTFQAGAGRAPSAGAGRGRTGR